MYIEEYYKEKIEYVNSKQQGMCNKIANRIQKIVSIPLESKKHKSKK